MDCYIYCTVLWEKRGCYLQGGRKAEMGTRNFMGPTDRERECRAKPAAPHMTLHAFMAILVALSMTIT